MLHKRGLGFWFFIWLSILLLLFLLAGQTYALFDYKSAVSLGLQESTTEVGSVGVAFAKGFAFGDTVIYVPLLVIGIAGLLQNKKWGAFAMFGSLAISVYWPLVHLFAIFNDPSVFSLETDKILSFSIILPLISIYGLWGMWYIYRDSGFILEEK